MMKRPDLDTILARCEKASPLPWTSRDNGNGHHGGEVFDGGEMVAKVYCGAYKGHGRANAKFIAEARSDVPELVAYILELEKQRDALLAWANLHPHLWQCQVYDGFICTCGWESLVELK